MKIAKEPHRKEPLDNTLFNALLFCSAFAVVLIVQGAIPFLTAPTLGQAIWTAGFGQSFINESLFNIYAHNFGAPEPAAIAFGLAGAWPTGLFIKLGLQPIDAYTLMVTLWLSVAFYSAFAIGRYFALSRVTSILGALAWGTMPVIWANSGYSMLSLGFALLPFYLLSSLRLFHISDKKSIPQGVARIGITTFSLFACIISVFMDGYSFMMFAVASSIIGAISFIQNRRLRDFYLKLSVPIHFIGFAAAYFLYTHYIGRSEFDVDPLDSVRSGGLDLTFLIIPTKGVSWLMDLFGASLSRSDRVFFGDAAVWRTTYLLPILLFAFWSLFSMRKEFGKASPFFLCLISALYLSLGPSLKINSQRPSGQENLGAMPASLAVFPTGSAFLSQYVPGFKNMRCCYRWTALVAFSAWLIILQNSALKKKKCEWVTLTALGIITIINLPNLSLKYKEYIRNRESFYELERDWVDDMKEVVKQGDRVAFLPWRNDFLATYLAPRLKITTYNTGGDKNLAAARRHWPKYMSRFTPEAIDCHFSERILHLLEADEADQVILPYVDFRWAAHIWPYPTEFKNDMQAALDNLSTYSSLIIEQRKHYSIIKLTKQRRSIHNEVSK